ncbi:hypothetical protein KSK55_05455 [Methanospirillum purgamenti]|jgi:hypothetical protein|uniref:Uncharacterized protein n=1 Tax=Methanospirillum hungatei TaxID=2203 RepID=A0A8F5VMK8_METHU|nr:hypothetical protein [Methanospirillum hungatei]QXO95836.1 hypothetical protein KSK55_05455 [Methanospirillum hungatei]
MSGSIPKIILGSITFFLVAIGLFLLFAITMEVLETSRVLCVILGIFVVYSACILPAIDRRVERSKSGDEDTGNRRYRVKKENGLKIQKRRRYWDLISYLALLTGTFVVVYLVVLLMHELSHSLLAVLLGAKQDPLDIVYGSWIGSHWDENVDYTSLFATGKGTLAATIACAGPFSNILLFIITAWILSIKAMKNHPRIFHCIFWTCIVTFSMVFEYVYTRSFQAHDDFGNITHGLGISPWWIFITGTILGIIALYYIITQLLPTYLAIVIPNNRLLQYTAVSFFSFIIFLFYIGLRITNYPDVPEWWCGVSGIAALFIVPFLASPARGWVKRRMKADFWERNL